MIPYAAVQGYSTALDQLSVASLADLRALMTSVEELSPARQRAVLFEAFPEVFNPYAATASAVSASFYDEVREMAEAKGAFAAETLDSVETPRWHALVGAGTAPSMFERGGSALIYSFLSGGMTAIMSEMASDTMIGNAQIDRVQVGYQRVPRPGCCAFCALIASRGDLFKSEDDARLVQGRGVPVGEGRGRGSKGRGRGIKPRGSRAIGEKYHDHCRCRGVPVFEDNYVEMQSDADKYYDAYRASADKVNDGLTLKSKTYTAPDGSKKNKYEWVHNEAGPTTPQQRTKMILASMRADLGVR